MLGQKKELTIDKQVFLICNDLCSDSLGFLYSQANLEKFSKIKKEATDLLSIIMKSAKKSVYKLNWLSESSKKIAIFKLDKMKHQIAFPDVWFNEFDCHIDKSCFIRNLFSLKKVEAEFDIKRLLQKKQADIWDNACYDVNAFYYTELNLLCIPIGFLNPPFFSLKQSFVQNLAGLGNIMAHEIAHGFDEEGRKYDEKGNYKPWWTSTDIEMYSVKTRKLIDFFDRERYTGLKVNGELTLGENLADLGAMAICLEALKERHNLKPELRIKELRDFFTWYAKTWIYKETKEKREQAIKKDRHAPPQIRVNAVIRQFQEFYDAFSIKDGDPGWLSKMERIDIWG
jgi:putative endopeptidase